MMLSCPRFCGCEFVHRPHLTKHNLFWLSSKLGQCNHYVLKAQGQISNLRSINSLHWLLGLLIKYQTWLWCKCSHDQSKECQQLMLWVSSISNLHTASLHLWNKKLTHTWYSLKDKGKVLWDKHLLSPDFCKCWCSTVTNFMHEVKGLELQAPILKIVFLIFHIAIDGTALDFSLIKSTFISIWQIISTI